MANPSLQIGNSNWAIKEDNLLGYSTAGTRFVPQPITMTRESAGTRVNSSGLVETVELLGSEDVRDGNFPTPNTEWGTAAGWTIADNKATSAGANEDAYLTQSNMVLGKTYKVTFDVDDYTSGALSVRVFGQSQVLAVTSTGSYVVYLTPVSTTVLGFRSAGGAGGYVGSVSNVSVKESTKNNLARVDYDGTASSLLVEPERTNLISYSEDFSQWSVNQVTIEPNAIISPDGTLNASRMTPTTTSSVHLISTSGSTTMAMSVYAKSNGYHRFRFNSGSSGNGYASFDLNAGTVLNSGGTYYTSSSIDSVGNGWYRCTLVLTSGVASAPNLAIEDNSGNVSFIGDGTSAIYIWAGQAEVGSYPTSYIPTDGGTVTRNQDQYSKTGISNLINSEEGVLFVEAKATYDSSTSRRITLSDGSISNRVSLEFDDSVENKIKAFITLNGASIILEYSGADLSQYNKIAIKYKLNDFALWVNGFQRDTDNGNVPTGMTKLSFDGGNGANFFYGKVKQLQVYKTADIDLAALTS